MRGNIPDWGGGDYRDIMAGVDEVIKRGIADPQKLALDGLELRWLHDVLGRLTDDALQSRADGRRPLEHPQHVRYD